MKYGSELSRRSVPEWKAYNLDYNEIKQVIKKATSSNAPPNAANTVYEALMEQYDSIGLFVKSKSGEVDRRVDHCEQLVESIAGQDEKELRDSTVNTNDRGPVNGPPRPNSYLMSRTRQTTLARLRQEIVRLTHDVQSLARFVGVQRTGFRKLLKKYKKWSNSNALSERMLPILEAPKSWTNQDFTSNFLELSFLYDILREARITRVLNQTPLKLPNESLCKFDCEMATSVSNSVSLWVHYDNIVETKVALLKNLSLFSDPKGARLQRKSRISLRAVIEGENETAVSSSAKDDVGSQITPNGSASNLLAAPKRPSVPSLSSTSSTDSSGVIYLDNPRKFYSIRSSTEPGQIRWADDPYQSSYVLCSPIGGIRHFSLTNLSKDLTLDILSGDKDAITRKLDTLDSAGKLAVGWVQKRSATPISKAVFKRTRFKYIIKESDPTYSERTGYSSRSDSGLSGPSSIESTSSALGSPISNLDQPDIWAALDTDIKITKVGASKLGWASDLDSTTGEPSDTKHFPHAVLEIRWKGMSKPSWITDLERSTLVYPVNGFSFYSQSVATYYPDALSQLPSWLKILDQGIDIHKLPSRPIRSRDPSSTNVPTLHLQAPGITISGAAVSPGILLNIETPQVNSKLRRPPPSIRSSEDYSSDGRSASEASLYHHKPPVVRYWNEFDDPEDDPESSVFVISSDDEIHDNGLLSESNIEYLVRLSDRFASGLIKAADKARLFLHLGGSPRDSEYAHLETTDDDDDEDDDDDDDTDHAFNTYSPRFKAHYGGVQDEEFGYESFIRKTVYSQKRDNVLTVLYTICFTLGGLIVATLMGVIAGEDMEAVTFATYLFTILGMIFAVGIAVLGMCLFMLRSEFPSWIHHTLVYSSFFSIICFGVGGIVFLIS